MRFLLMFLLLLPIAATAQDDRGYIQGLLEDALSAEGRTVRIEGFAGALSSRATIARITVSDPDGIWLEIERAALTWQRTALFTGRVAIDEISAERLTLSRPPLPAPTELPAAAAPGRFQLPALPVSLNLGALDVQEVILGEALIGEEVVLRVRGSAGLADGAGQAELAIERLDAGGAVTLRGGFDNTTRVLDLALSAQEPAGGIAARQLGLPGAPSTDLQITGTGPIDDYTAQIRLATDGSERLGGEVTLRGAAGADQSFAADLSGDLAPLLAPDYRAFLGRDVGLRVAGTRRVSGALDLDTLDLSAEALTLTGAAQIAADGWPERFDLSGRIAGPEASVLLPIPGPQTRVGQADIIARFDAATGNRWTLIADMIGFDRPDLDISRLSLAGDGVIDRDTSEVTGALRLDGTGIAPSDAALARAIGQSLAGALRFDWLGGDAPLRLTEIDLGGADYGLQGAVTLNGLSDDLNLRIAPDLTLRADDLARFADLAGVPVTGAAQLAVSGEVAPLGGLVDLTLGGETRDLTTGIVQVDPLLRGAARLDARVVRDETGTALMPLRLTSQAARIEAEGRLQPDGSDLQLAANLTNIGDVQPGLSGPASLTATASQSGERWDVDATVNAPGETLARFDGSVTGDGSAQLLLDGALTATVGQLAAYQSLAGRPIGGALALRAEGRGDALSRTFSGQVRLNGTSLRTGIAQVDGLLVGASELRSVAAYQDGTLQVDSFALQSTGVSVNASGTVADQNSALRLDARLNDAGAVQPGLRGAATVNARAVQSGQRWDVDATVTAPGDTVARFDGSVTGDGSTQLLLDGLLTASVDQLSAYQALAGRPLGGAISVRADGRGDALSQTFQGTVRVNGTSLRSGIAQVDTLLTGPSQLTTDASYQNGTLRLASLALNATGISLDASGTVSANGGDLRLATQVRDLGRLVPDLPGPASLNGTARRNGGPWRIDVAGTGPRGITLNVNGTAAQDVSRLNLAATGVVPLALANPRISPRTLEGLVRLDLAVNGPPQLSAVSGSLRTEGARLTLPTLRNALNDLALTVQLGGARATLEGSARLDSGGTLALSGPVSLEPPFVADLAAQLSNLAIEQAGLFRTIADGRVTMSGALQGGASIGGRIRLETVEARLPNFGPSYQALEGLRHVNPPADVLRTLQFAGLNAEGRAAPSGPTPSYPIDLVIDAPNRIFVRGRGLDAELGGSLRLLGSTDDLRPQGSFDLIRGRLDLLGRRLVLTEGAVSLRGSFSPFIRLAASTDVEDTQITVAIEGPADDPELIITSQPALPEEEALSLLLFGRELTTISPLQAVQLAQAIRTLSGAGGGGVLEQVRTGLRIDDLDIGTNAEGTAQARIGAYVSKNIYTDVTVTAEGDSEINLNLDVTNQLTIKGRLGSDGDTGIGLFFERDY